MDLPDDETRCVESEGRARRFGAKIGRLARWALCQKNQKPQNGFFGQNRLLPNNLVWSRFEVKIWNFSS